MNVLSKKKVILIAGPTAVGKTSVAFQLAQNFSTEIISADSRQCYRELNIGVARPPKEFLDEIRHFFIASHSIQEDVNAATFAEYAVEKSNKIFEKNQVLILTGGTGLYIKAFLEGLDTIPPVSPSIRQGVIDAYEKNGLKWLQEQIQAKDKLFYERGEMQNPQRLMRALEVVEATGKSIFSFHNQKMVERDFDVIKIGLELPKEELNRNIDTRVDQMIESGLVNEVRQLLVFRDLNAMQTVGYKELIDFLDGKSSLEEAIQLIKQSTRQYAKRQMTWFRKDKDLTWFSPHETNKIMEYIVRKLKEE